jgi:hypothetical protein
MKFTVSRKTVNAVNYMPFGESHVPGLQLCMALFAAVAMLLGLGMAIEGQVSVALTNFCGALFFVFAYYNPDIMLTDASDEPRPEQKEAVQQKFLWTSLAVGVLAFVLEFTEHLPLG